MEYGYARVSSKDQNEDRQRIALMEAGIPEERIFVDKKSGKDFERPAYKQMLHLFQKGDVLYIKSIDRLGRNYNEIQEQWRYLTKKKEIDIVVLDMPLLDTRQGKNLVGTFVSDLVLQVLSFVAENERANIRQRQAEGIAAAKARGKHLGRPFRPLPPNFHEVYRRWMDGELTCIAAAKAVGMPRSTFLYRVRYMREVGLLERENLAAEKYTLLQPSNYQVEKAVIFDRLHNHPLWNSMSFCDILINGSAENCQKLVFKKYTILRHVQTAQFCCRSGPETCGPPGISGCSGNKNGSISSGGESPNSVA